MPSITVDGGTVGDNVIIGGTSGKAIRVVSMCLVSSAIVGVRFSSGAMGTGSGTSGATQHSLTGLMELAANQALVWDYTSEGWITTDEDESLTMVLYRSGSIGGVINYILMDTQ